MLRVGASCTVLSPLRTACDVDLENLTQEQYLELDEVLGTAWKRLGGSTWLGPVHKLLGDERFFR
jgi:hypothetical protein